MRKSEECTGQRFRDEYQNRKDTVLHSTGRVFTPRVWQHWVSFVCLVFRAHVQAFLAVLSVCVCVFVSVCALQSPRLWWQQRVNSLMVPIFYVDLGCTCGELQWLNWWIWTKQANMYRKAKTCFVNSFHWHSKEVSSPHMTQPSFVWRDKHVRHPLTEKHALHISGQTVKIRP